MEEYIIEINGTTYDTRNLDDRECLVSMGYFDKEKNNVNIEPIIPIDKNNIQPTIIFTKRKVGNMAIPLFPKALEDADYVVLSTLLDEKYSTYDNINKPNYRIISRQTYLKKKEEMINSCNNGDIEKLEHEKIKTLSVRQWERSFKKLRELGIVETIKEGNKIKEYHIYNKSLEGKEDTLCECEIIRALKRTYKSTAIKAYVYIRSQCWDYNTKTFKIKQISLVDICHAIGLSENTRHDLFKILCELQASKFINIYECRKRSVEGDYNILYYEYEIVPFDKWEDVRRPIPKYV